MKSARDVEKEMRDAYLRCVTFIIVYDLGLHDFLLVSVLQFLHKCFTARNYMLA